MENISNASGREIILRDSKSLKDFIEEFLIAHDVKEVSRESYRRRLKDFQLWIDSSSLSTIEKATLVAYKRSLRDRKFSANTQSGNLVAVRCFFSWLESEKLFPNISKGIKGPRRQKGFRKDPLTIPQIHRLLSSIDRTTLKGKRDYALLNLMVRTGPRSIEIVRADIEDLRQEAGQPVLWLQGKGSDSKDAYVVLTESALSPIMEYLVERKNVKGDDSLFASVSDGNRHQRLSTRAIRRIVKQRLRGVSIENPRISAHSFRHTAITLSLMAGASLQEAQAMARHASPQQTSEYAQNLERASGIPEKKIDDLLRKMEPGNEV